MYSEKDHTWSICAYGESVYLEEAICSVLRQTIPTKVIMITATPNAHIQSLAEKYKLPLYINEGEKGIANDWNFAYQKANTKLVTLCHQDDIYEETYIEKILERINKKKKTLIAFSDYGELRDGAKVTKNKLLAIKRMLLFPLRFSFFQQSVWIRRRCLSLGNCICCPAVTYVKENLPERIFFEKYKSNVDWQTWEAISRQKGSFLFLPEILMYHRIHQESTTTEIIGESLRTKEDYEMFRKFWPDFIAKRISKVYQTSEDSNNVFCRYFENTKSNNV